MALVHVDQLQPKPYDPRLYLPVATVQPMTPGDAIRPAEEEQYRTLGFLSYRDFFSPDCCQLTVDALLELADRAEPPTGLELNFEALSDPSAAALPIETRQDHIRKFMWFVRHDPRFLVTAEDSRLLSFVEHLLGAEPELFQEMALFKPPGIGREKPWHQDHAYFNLPMGTPVVGVWIALDDADLENGCMVFQPGAHRSGPLPHFNRRDWQICDSEILEKGGTVAAPLPAGGCLIFDGMTPHGTPMNRSPKRRRALQYHFIPKGTPRITTEERMALFGQEGAGATC